MSAKQAGNFKAPVQFPFMTVARVAFYRVLILGEGGRGGSCDWAMAIGRLAIGALGMNNPGTGRIEELSIGKLIVDELIVRRRSESLR